MMKILLAAFALFLALTAHAAIEVAGIKFEDKTMLGNAELVLNGAGMRKKFFIKAYAIGLYATEKKSTAGDMLALTGTKRLHIVTLLELSAEQFADALVAGIHHNLSEADIAPLQARIEKFQAAILSLKVAPKGATVHLDWLPATGTRLLFNGEKIGDDIPGDDFYRALLLIWLGDHPVQDDLKSALLGK